jgi:hypothetical protein
MKSLLKIYPLIMESDISLPCSQNTVFRIYNILNRSKAVHIPISYFLKTHFNTEPGYLSRYSDGLRVGELELDSQRGQVIFLCTKASRPVLGPTQRPIALVSGGSFPGGWSSRSLKLTTHLHLRLRFHLCNYACNVTHALVACVGATVCAKWVRKG